MAITEDDVADGFIAQSKALLITGTHFSTPQYTSISRVALERARAHDVRTILDIDYRPVLWGLTKRGDGETRFVASDTVTAHLQAILPTFDLVIGTEEEFKIAGGSTDIIASLEAVRRMTKATLVVKRGPMGCAVIDGAIPRSLDDAFNGRGVTVEVLNVLGAGDAFSAGFLSGWVRGEDYDACCRYANACGALVVSRHGCAPAMPTRVELDYFIANAERIPRPDQDVELTRLHRVTAPRAPRPELFVFAFDHRDPFFELAREAGADERRIPALKRLLVEAVGETEARTELGGSIGLLCDDRYGQDALNAATGRGWWIGRPVELPGSNPVVFEHGRSIGTTLVSWPREHVVKCLVPFHPDDEVDKPPRKGGADPHALRRRAGERTRAPARDHSAEGSSRGSRHAAARGEAPLQSRNLSRMVEAAATREARMAGDRRADRRARPVLPRRRAARVERAGRRAGAELRRRRRQPHVPRLRRRAHDLRRACARVARGRHRRRATRRLGASDVRGIDPRVAQRSSRERERMTTIRLTMAQALVRYLCAQRTILEGREVPLFAGVFAIFGHGNVAGVGEALYRHRAELPTFRAHNEQAMAHAAIAFAKAHFRRRMMACTTSIGPGATNLVTAAAMAHVNRLPVLFLPGDMFVSRAPDPVLQQVEDFDDRRRFRERLLPAGVALFRSHRRSGATAHRAAARDRGPHRSRALRPGDARVAAGRAGDGVRLSRRRSSRRPGSRFPPMQRPNAEIDAARPSCEPRSGRSSSAAAACSTAKAGAQALTEFAETHGVPVAETQAGKGALSWDHPLQAGPIGVTGGTAANALAQDADVVIAVGTRLQDFTTGSHTLFPRARLVAINVNAFDAAKWQRPR